MCAARFFSVIVCSFYHFLDIILFHHDFNHHTTDNIGIFMAILYILNYIFRLSILSSSDSVNAHLPGCFRPWIFLLNNGLNMLPPDCSASCLLGYSTGSSMGCK